MNERAVLALEKLADAARDIADLADTMHQEPGEIAEAEAFERFHSLGTITGSAHDAELLADLAKLIAKEGEDTAEMRQGVGKTTLLRHWPAIFTSLTGRKL